MKILFITANRVGDAVLTTGVLEWLVAQYPHAQFTIACGPYGADIFRATPRLQNLIIMKKKRWNGHWYELWQKTIGTNWDLIVDFRNSIVSRLLHAKKRAIHSAYKDKHKVIENAAILNLTPPPSPHIWLTQEAEKTAQKLIPSNRPIIAFGPAANWPPKQWPINYFIELSKILTNEDTLPQASIMVIADQNERAQITPLLEAIPFDQRIEIIGYDLQIAAACLKRACLFVGNDSGLMHLSAALGVPTLGLFGPGFPHIYGPWGKKCALAQTVESREQLVARLPNIKAREPNLMGSLKVETVARIAKDLLARTR